MKSNYRKIIFFILIFTIILVIIEKAIDYSYEKISGHKITMLMRHEIDEEIMVFGSSIAYHQFDPEIVSKKLGKSCFNMGWDGTFFIQYQGLIKEYLSYSKKCKYLIVIWDTESFGKNELITRPDLYYAYFSNQNIFSSLYEIEPNMLIKSKYVPGYKLTLLNKSFYKELLSPTSTQSIQNLRGYSPIAKLWTKEQEIKNSKTKPFNARFDQRIFDLLEETIKEIKKEKKEIIFVFPPVYKQGQSLILNFAQIKNKLRDAVSENGHFLDYTEESICNNSSFFVDNSHLNQDGAKVFSEKLATDLERIINKP